MIVAVRSEDRKRRLAASAASLGEGKHLAQNDNIDLAGASMPASMTQSVHEIRVAAHRHLVRVGLLGQLGRFDAVDGIRHPRRTRVLCRTARGLEVGEVLSASDANGHVADGDLIRRLTVEDELLLARLDRHRDEAFRACQRLLAASGTPEVLMDVEHLFDGQTLYFYFLGEVTPELTTLTSKLAEEYETKVQIGRFVETLTRGCGPGCGTEEAAGAGCSTGACGSCAVAGACHPRGQAG